MKAVILAGGLGTRLREETEHKPKPMVEIGGRPVLWHIMKNLSRQGIREFVILAGYKSHVIRDFFLNYRTSSHDFSIEMKSGQVRFRSRLPEDESEWKVTILDTGVETDTGDRLKHYLSEMRPKEPFLLTYGDGLANVNLAGLMKTHEQEGRLATVTAVRAQSRFGQIKREGQKVIEFIEKPALNDLVSIGFFILDPGVQSLLGGDRVGPFESEPMKELVSQEQLSTFLHEGFWKAMDTYREYLELQKIWNQEGGAPW